MSNHLQFWWGKHRASQMNVSSLVILRLRGHALLRSRHPSSLLLSLSVCILFKTGLSLAHRSPVPSSHKTSQQVTLTPSSSRAPRPSFLLPSHQCLYFGCCLWNYPYSVFCHFIFWTIPCVNKKVLEVLLVLNHRPIFFSPPGSL